MHPNALDASPHAAGGRGMSVIAQAVKHLLAAGVTGDALVAAIEDMEAADANEPSNGAVRQGRYRRRLGVSLEEWESLRADVFARDNFTCVYCGEETDNPQCDHIIPLSRGGGSNFANLATACKRCNSGKRDRTPQEWRPSWA